jgi:hypothetical protein
MTGAKRMPETSSAAMSPNGITSGWFYDQADDECIKELGEFHDQVDDEWLISRDTLCTLRVTSRGMATCRANLGFELLPFNSVTISDHLPDYRTNYSDLHRAKVTFFTVMANTL